MDVIIYVLLLDAIMYWLHRAFHLPILYKYFHSAHHYSKQPTALTAKTAHPFEAITFAICGIASSLVLPTHKSIAVAVTYYLYFSKFARHIGHHCFSFLENFKYTKGIVLSSDHEVHHLRPNKNYGTLFNFWDKLMNTYDRTV